MSWIEWTGLGIGVYLLIGYLQYRWVEWLLNVKHGEHFDDTDKYDFDQVVSLVIVMVLWPSIFFPWMTKIVVGYYQILKQKHEEEEKEGKD